MHAKLNRWNDLPAKRGAQCGRNALVSGTSQQSSRAATAMNTARLCAPSPEVIAVARHLQGGQHRQGRKQHLHQRTQAGRVGKSSRTPVSRVNHLVFGELSPAQARHTLAGGLNSG